MSDYDDDYYDDRYECGRWVGKRPNWFTRKWKRLSWKGKLIVFLVVIALLAGSALYVRSKMHTDQTQQVEEPESKSQSVSLGLKNIGEFATESAYMTVVNQTDDSKHLFSWGLPFTESKYLYSYNVVIKFGYDFTKATEDVDQESKVISVHLPETEVLSDEVDYDSLTVYEENESPLNNISLQENNDAVKQLKETAERDAINNGAMDAAQQNAVTFIRSFAKQGWPDYTVIVYDSNNQEILLPGEESQLPDGSSQSSSSSSASSSSKD